MVINTVDKLLWIEWIKEKHRKFWVYGAFCLNFIGGQL